MESSDGKPIKVHVYSMQDIENEPKSFGSIWRRVRVRIKIISPTVRHEGGSIRIWGSVSARGRGKPAQIDERMDFSKFGGKCHTNAIQETEAEKDFIHFSVCVLQKYTHSGFTM